jgi:hypothetical protein
MDMTLIAVHSPTVKEGCLFVLSHRDLPDHRAQLCSLVTTGKPLMSKVASRSLIFRPAMQI